MEQQRIRNVHSKNHYYQTENNLFNKTINKTKNNFYDPNLSRSKSGNRIKDNSLSPQVMRI